MQISYNKILAVCLTVSATSPAYAINWTTCNGGQIMCSNNYTVHPDAEPEHCMGSNSVEAFCVKDSNNREWAIRSCSGGATNANPPIDTSVSASATHCQSGYKLYPMPVTVAGCTVYFTTCIRDYSGSCDLSTESAWKKVANGYDRRCAEIYDEFGDVYIRYEYRCRTGYWGVAQFDGSNYSGCHSCPENAACSGGNTPFICLEEFYREGDHCAICPSIDNGTYGIIYSYSDMGAVDISQCYIMKNSTGQDASGTYKISQDCYYQP